MIYGMPITIDIDITSRCNLNCVHCNKYYNKLGRDLPLLRLIELCDELYDLGIAELSLGGGEPLIRKDWFDLLSHICAKPGWSISLNTNGILWTLDHIDKIKSLKYPPRIAVSLDGHSPLTYSVLRRDKYGAPAFSAFGKVINTINSMKIAGLNVCANFVVTDVTAKWLLDTIDLAQYLKIDSFLLLKLMPTNRPSGSVPRLSYYTWKKVLQKITMKKKRERDFYSKIMASVACPWELLLPLYEMDIELEEIYELWRYQSPFMSPYLRMNRDIGCPAGISYCCISADGIVTPCSAITSEHQQAQCGNIVNRKFETIWQESSVIKILQSIKLDDLQCFSCKKCTIKEICGGGCRARGLFATGSITGPDIECPLILRESHG